MAMTVLGLVMDGETGSKKKEDDLSLENQSLGELLQLVDMYMKQLDYRKRMGKLTPDLEKQLTEDIDYVLEVIDNRKRNDKKRQRDGDDCSESTSNTNKKVS